jgi:microcystin-dependent protein
MANFLKSLFVKGVEIDTASATTGKVLTYDGTKFAPASPGAGSLALDDLSDAVITSPATGSTLYFDGTNWIDSTTLIPNVSDTLVGRNTTDTLTNKTLTTPTINGPTITATGQTPVIHGILLPNTHGIYFEGATTDANQTYLYCVDPTADRTILLPNVDGTIITTGDTGSVTSTMILDGTILNADINTAAAIALSKLASGTSAQVVIANGSGVPTYNSLTGDVTVTNTGVTAIGANKVTRSMLAATEQMPVGTILMWAGGSTTTATYTDADVPTGFLLCDGTAVSRTTYLTLFQNLDIRYGQGDGSTTFNLPNLIAFAPVGSKTASAKTSGIRGNANAAATSYTTTGATSTTAHHSHTLTGSNSTASNIAITGANTGGSNLYITGGNSNIADNQHRHVYQKPTSNYFQTDTGFSYAVSGSNSNIGLAGSNASASNIGLSGSNAAASNLSAATLTSGNTTAHSHTISGHAVVYIIKY